MADLDSLDRQVQGILGRLKVLETALILPPSATTTVMPTSALKAGAFNYVDSGDATEGPYWYTGSSWQAPYNVSWPCPGETHSTPGLTNVTTITDVLTLNWTSVAGRRYIILSQIRATMTGAGGTVTASLTDSSNNNLAAVEGVTITATNNTATLHPMMYPRNPGAGARADKLRIASTAAISTTGEASVWVLDVGGS